MTDFVRLRDVGLRDSLLGESIGIENIGDALLLLALLRLLLREQRSVDQQGLVNYLLGRFISEVLLVLHFLHQHLIEVQL